MDIKQLRRHNTLRLIQKQGITKADFARKIDKSPQHVQVFLREKNPGNIGHKVAREIEAAFSLQQNWLDQEQDVRRGYAQLDNLFGAYRQAEKFAEALMQTQQDWLKSRRLAVRMVEDDFSDRLLSEGFSILELGGEFGFQVASTRKPFVTINLFIPMPGFSRWMCPGIEGEQPDFLVIPFLGEADVEYAIIPKSEYLQWEEEAPFRAAIRTLDRTASDRGLQSFIGRFDLI